MYAGNNMPQFHLDTQTLVKVAKQHRLAYLAVFGSYARGEATAQSDVDLVARFGRPVTLFEVLDVQHEMEDVLGLDVDLIVEEAVVPHPFVREQIMKEAVVLYEDPYREHATAE